MFWLTLGFLASPTAMATKVHVNVVVPPREPVSGVRSLRVARFTGPAGENMADWVREALTDSGRGYVNPKATTLHEGFRVDVMQVVTSGGDAVLSGDIDVADRIEDSQQEVAVEDDDGNILKDDDGNVITKTQSCQTKIVTASVQWRLDKRGTIVSQGSASSEAQDMKCGDAIDTLTDTRTLGEQAARAFPYGIANAIAPRWATMSLEVNRDKTLKEAWPFVRKGNLAKAACGFKAVVDQEPYNVDAIYGLGALLAAQGFHTESHGFFDRATAVNGYKDAAKTQAQVRAREGQVQVLESHYGMTRQPFAVDFSGCQVAASKTATGSEVVVKKKTTSLLSGPEVGAPPVASLPKGMKLTVLATAGETLQVRTLDGTEGWVDASHVK